MLITCPLIQEEVRQGHEPPLRLPGLDFKQSLALCSSPSGLTHTVIKHHNNTDLHLFYIKYEWPIKTPYGEFEAFNCSINCVVIMRLWGGQLGLIPVTCCGTNITGEGIDAWSNWQVDVFGSTHVGKNRRMCNRAEREGRCFTAVGTLLVLRAHLRRGWLTFPEVVKHLHMELHAEGKLLVISSITHIRNT